MAWIALKHPRKNYDSSTKIYVTYLSNVLPSTTLNSGFAKCFGQHLDQVMDEQYVSAPDKNDQLRAATVIGGTRATTRSRPRYRYGDHDLVYRRHGRVGAHPV